MTSLPPELRANRPPGHVAVTIGVFDGVHRGHQYLLRTLRDHAAARGLTPVVVTFANHPLTVLRPDVQLILITPLDERLTLIREQGIAHVVPITFTRDVSLLLAEEFVGALARDLGMRHLVVGPDFALGYQRKGTVQRLAEIGRGAGFTVEAVPLLTVDGLKPKSTTIRNALAVGDLPTVERCLGRRFAVRGVVVRGEARGAGLGFPTANLGIERTQALPADGIYAAWATVDGARHAAAVSVGAKPTFHEHGERVLEAHLLDFAGNLYGKDIRLEFVRRLRGQERFDTIDALIAQIHRDVDETRMALATPRLKSQAW